MRYENITKRILSLVLAVAMLVSFLPAVQWAVEAEAVETKAAETKATRKTMYFSSSEGTSWGSYESFNSINNPGKLSKASDIAKWLNKGYNVMLKRGDIWEFPTFDDSMTLQGIRGTADSPVVLGAYGEGADPVIGFLKRIKDNAWTCVDTANNIYEADVSNLVLRNGISTHRCFVNDVPYTHNLEASTNKDISKLKAGEHCSFDKKVYVRMASGKPTNVEATNYNGGHRIFINDVEYLTIENIHIKGGNAISSMIYMDAPTKYLKFDSCKITHCFYYIMMWETDDENIHYKPEISNCYIDAMFNEAEGATNNDNKEGTDLAYWNHWSTSRTEGITLRDGVDGAWIHHNTIRNMSHAFIAIETLSENTTTDSEGNVTNEGYKTTGVRNCIIEDNLLEGGNVWYARAFNICGGYN